MAGLYGPSDKIHVQLHSLTVTIVFETEFFTSHPFHSGHPESVLVLSCVHTSCEGWDIYMNCLCVSLNSDVVGELGCRAEGRLMTQGQVPDWLGGGVCGLFATP